MTQRFEQTIIDLVESTSRTIRTAPLILGGTGGQGGGAGTPPGGFVGQLPQYRVAYDTTEAATSGTMPSGVTGISGWSLVDNLNHIRYRLNVLESGGMGGTFTVIDGNTSSTYTNVDTLRLSGGVLVTDLGGGDISVQVTASGGGGSLPFAVVYQNTPTTVSGIGIDLDILADTELIDDSNLISIHADEFSNYYHYFVEGWYAWKAKIELQVHDGSATVGAGRVRFIGNSWGDGSSSDTSVEWGAGDFPYQIVEMGGTAHFYGTDLDYTNILSFTAYVDSASDQVSLCLIELSAIKLDSGGGGGGTLNLQVGEQDGSPLISNVDKILFSGATVTDLGGGDTLIQIVAGSGGTALTVKEQDGSPSITNVNTIAFSGAVVSDLGAGNVLVAIAASSGGSGTALTVKDADNSPTVSNVDTIVFSGFLVTDLGTGDVQITNNLGVTSYIDQSGGTSDSYGVLSGSINNSNKTFTVSRGQYISGTLEVYLNGVLQIQGTTNDWTETNPATGTFTFVTAPISGDELTVKYKIYSGSMEYAIIPSSGVLHIYNEDHSNQAGPIYTTNRVYASGTLRVYYNGLRQRKDYHYSERAGYTTYSTFFPTYSGDVMIVDYDYLG